MKERLSRRRHPAVNFITGFFAVLLSIVLVITVFATALYSSITTLITKEKLAAVTQGLVDNVVDDLFDVDNLETDQVEEMGEAQSANDPGSEQENFTLGKTDSGNTTEDTVIPTVGAEDSEDLITDNEVVQDNIDFFGLSPEAVKSLLKSNACAEVIELYTQDVTAALMGDEITNQLTADKLKEIVAANIDEIVKIAVEMTGETDKAEELKQMITETIDTEADKIIVSLPKPEQVVQPIQESGILETIQLVMNPVILWIVIGVCVFFAALIYLLRCYRFGGLLWVGIDLLLSGLLLVVLRITIPSPPVTNLLNELAQDLSQVVTATVSVYTSGLSARMLLVLGLALLFIGGYIALYVTVLKKNPVPAEPIAKELAAIEESVEETTPVAEINE